MTFKIITAYGDSYRSNFFLALMLFVGMGLTGCGPIHTGSQISHDTLHQLGEGKATKAEVLALFGEYPTSQPREIANMPDGGKHLFFKETWGTIEAIVSPIKVPKR